MNWFVTAYAALLFFLLTPAILLRLPPNGSKYTVAIVHALVFALIFHFTHKLVWQFSMSLEGFVEGRGGGSGVNYDYSKPLRCSPDSTDPKCIAAGAAAKAALNKYMSGFPRFLNMASA